MRVDAYLKVQKPGQGATMQTTLKRCSTCTTDADTIRKEEAFQQLILTWGLSQSKVETLTEQSRLKIKRVLARIVHCSDINCH
jgi:adenylate cyclase